MKSILLLLVLFLCIGLCARTFKGWVRFCLIGVIASMILYVTFA